MNDYLLLKTGKDITAERIAEADRARLARAARPSADAERPSARLRQHRAAVSLGAIFQRVALF